MGGQKEGGLLGSRETYKGGDSPRGSKWRTDEETGAHSHFDKDYKLFQTTGKLYLLIFDTFSTPSTSESSSAVAETKSTQYISIQWGSCSVCQCS